MEQIKELQEKQEIRKKYLVIALLVTLIGGALALYATNLTIQLAKHQVVNGGICNFNEWISCDAVLSTKFATMFGIPVAWFGFIFYLWASVTLLSALFRKKMEKIAASSSIVLVGASAAVLFSIYKAVQLVILKVLCPVCVGMYLVNISLVLLLMPSLGISYRKIGSFLLSYIKSILGLRSDLTFSPKPILYSITFLWMFSIGFVGIKQYEKSIPELKEAEKPFIMADALEEHFKQPKVKIPVDPKAPVKGDTNSGVTIVEFADFECPACKELYDSMKTIWPEIGKEAKLYFMNYPLDQSINHYMKRKLHEHSGLAACAGICAQEEGDFWSYYDSLFKDQKEINRDFLLDLAAKHGWDKTKFSERMDSKDVIQRVKNNIEAGAAVDIQGTPYLYINGRQVKYWYRPDFIKAVVKEELKKEKKEYALQ